jgi:hypothetical protein
MNALFQRLKELDPATFEELCFQIWSERLPTAGLRHVEGTGGDKGTDLFAGTLAGRPAIWQCKFFKDGIKDAQKKQVKKSLRSALKNFRPALWTLCVPVKLTINAHHWFQEQTLAHRDQVKIELFDASMIVKEMIFRHPMMDAFFPGAVLDVQGIKSMLLGTGDYSDEQLTTFTDETVEQYVERLRRKDPRYDYQVSFLSGNAGIARTDPAARPLFPNTIMSMRQGNRQVDLVARDVEALRNDPPSITLKLSEQGVEKIQRALQSGSPAQLGHGELIGFKSSFDFLMSPEELRQPRELLITPQSLNIRVGLRVSFVSSIRTVIYDLIEFLITRGPKEIRIASADEHLPFRMQMAFSQESPSFHFEMSTSFHGYDILGVEKFFHAMRALREGGTIELFDPKRRQSIGPISIDLTEGSEEREEFEELTHQLAEASRAFAVKLVTPEVIHKKDIENLPLLLEVSRHGQITGGTVKSLKAKLVRDDRTPEAVFEPLANGFSVGVENESYPTQSLLGAEISLGPSRLIVENASLVDYEEVKTKYASLKPGESIPVEFNSDGPIHQVFHRFYKGEPLAPLVAP